MLKVQEYLKSGKSLEDLENDYSISSKVYDDRVILKYKMIDSQKYHPITMECRGLILSLPDFEVMCRPFDRFFNYGEGDDWKHFNWDNCKCFEKLDGSLINIYHNRFKDTWNVATKGTAFAEATTPMGDPYSYLVSEAINHVDFQKFCENLHPIYTYIFEITSPKNRIVTRYTETTLTLLAVRNKLTGEYLDYDVLEYYFPHMFPIGGVELVKDYSFNSAEKVIEFVESRGELDEGLVCYDVEKQLRMKIKNSSYVAIHHLRGNEVTVKSIVRLLLKGEMVEYLNYFPEDGDLVKPYLKKFNELMANVERIFMKYSMIEDQKEFALKVKDLPFAWMLFNMRKGQLIEEIFSIDNFNKIYKLF